MPLKRRLLGKNALLIAILLVPSVTLYLIFDFYLGSVGEELFESWHQSQAIDIQEGNLLSSISKNQRVLLSSRFVKGIELVDTADNAQRPLMELGASFTPLNLADAPIGRSVSKTVGFLHKQILFRPEGRPSLVLIFDISSALLDFSFVFTAMAFASFYIFLRALEIRQNHQRAQLVQTALNDFIQNEEPSGLIDSEFPALVFWWKEQKRALLESRRRELENEKLKVLGEMAAQVSHDIRSPLSALNIAASSVSGLSEEQRHLISSATKRINDIATTLLSKGKTAKARTNGSPFVPTGVLLAPLVESLVREKQVTFAERADVVIQADVSEASELAADADPRELARALSNLMNNSVEAFENGGNITVRVTGTASDVEIIVRDNGKGIPEHLLSKIGERGFSHGKENSTSGSGLGVYHARQTALRAGGQLTIQSIAGLGTNVTLRLPRAIRV